MLHDSHDSHDDNEATQPSLSLTKKKKPGEKLLETDFEIIVKI